MIVTEARSDGSFAFETILPPGPDCVGYIEDEDENEAVAVKVQNCNMRVRGFYTAELVTKIVPPGAAGSVLSACNLGDTVVNGQFVTFGNGFRITGSNIVIVGNTGIQQWLFAGVNDGSEDAEIRVAARCADVALR